MIRLWFRNCKAPAVSAEQTKNTKANPMTPKSLLSPELIDLIKLFSHGRQWRRNTAADILTSGR
jgi:hypothetical protein